MQSMVTQDRGREQELGRPLGHLASGEERVGSLCSRDRTRLQRLPQALTLPSSRALEWVLFVLTRIRAATKRGREGRGEEVPLPSSWQVFSIPVERRTVWKGVLCRDIAN